LIECKPCQPRAGRHRFVIQEEEQALRPPVFCGQGNDRRGLICKVNFESVSISLTDWEHEDALLFFLILIRTNTVISSFEIAAGFPGGRFDV